MFSEYMYRSKNYGTFCSWPFTTHFLNVWFLKKIGSNKIDKGGAYSVTACTGTYIEEQVIDHSFELEIINMWSTRLWTHTIS